MTIRLVCHADWSASPDKRWMATAIFQGNGHWLAFPAEPVGNTATLLKRLHRRSGDGSGPGGSMLIGFDFAIGLPLAFARRLGVDDFLSFLPQLGTGAWTDFFEVAALPEQVSLHRPFYPTRPRLPGEVVPRHAHLLEGLGVESIDDLRRACDRRRLSAANDPGRLAAAPLFWTLGGQQVGKAAICGWREVIQPALATPALGAVAVWPFSGELFSLLGAGYTVIAETYPAEFYTHLGLTFPRRGKCERSGKRVQAARLDNAARMMEWADMAGVAMHPGLRDQICSGFSPSPAGEDP
ncbi:MAG: hypothetical protein EHM70_25840, partial [Chloroflexota bacterium]